MAETRDFIVNKTWQTVNPIEDLSFALVQLKGDGPLLVFVGALNPDANSTEGILLTSSGLKELPLPGLGVGDRIKFRSLHDEDNPVSVYLNVSGFIG